jgi:hypothetical protein
VAGVVYVCALSIVVPCVALVVIGVRSAVVLVSATASSANGVLHLVAAMVSMLLVRGILGVFLVPVVLQPVFFHLNFSSPVGPTLSWGLPILV